MNRTLKWQKRFYQMAMLVATWSKDPSRKVGAVIVTPDFRSVSIGYNGFPREVDDSEQRLTTKDIRLALTVHAELNAIYNSGFSVFDCAIYTTKFPCHECAKGIVQVGIQQIVTPPPTKYAPGTQGTWAQSQFYATQIIAEAGIELVVINEKEFR